MDHIDDETTKMLIPFACFKILASILFFKKRLNRYHDLKFSPIIPQIGEEISPKFQRNDDVFYVENKIWQEVCNAVNRNAHFSSFAVDK